ncbi:MAG TPA: KGG domain-containing protein [Polyangiaceae bacterium]|nr:KGG domain-containing protein [Polyangiaceae bacterium]
MSSITPMPQTNPVEHSPTGNRAESQATGPAEQELRPDGPPRSLPQTEPGHAGTPAEARPRRPRGFAAIDRKLLGEIARKGGRAAHSAGTAHEFTSEEARVAGRKGGLASHAKRRKVDP